jgi:3-phosphoshikimate 1-carboxyvinyltransferase
VWKVVPAEIRGGVKIHCGLAGTVMRFVPPLALLADGPITLDGDEAARERPMGPLLDALRAMGATVDDAGRGSLPFTIEPPEDVPATVDVDASGSSQFVTGLLLTAPTLAKGLTVRHVGARLPSLPHIDMTCELLRDAGIRVDQPNDRTWVVHPGALKLDEVTVEPDLSNAGPFLAAALVAGGTVRVPHWPTTTTQPGALYPELLTQMGARCTLSGGVLTVTGPGRAGIRGIDADLSPAGEITPTIAALCALADGPSQITGIAHLRGHETDRLAAIAAEVQRAGGECEATEHSLRFGGWPDGGLRPAEMETYEDHRMATFAAIMGLAVPGIRVVNVGTTSKTLPTFPQLWISTVAVDNSAEGPAGA